MPLTELITDLVILSASENSEETIAVANQQIFDLVCDRIRETQTIRSGILTPGLWRVEGLIELDEPDTVFRLRVEIQAVR